MTSKKSQVKKRNMPYVYKDTTKPMKLENLSIRQLCIMELLSEESERADLEGHGGCLTLKRDRIEARVAEKMREKKETGKVSTFLTEEQFCTGDIKLSDAVNSK